MSVRGIVNEPRVTSSANSVVFCAALPASGPIRREAFAAMWHTGQASEIRCVNYAPDTHAGDVEVDGRERGW